MFTKKPKVLYIFAGERGEMLEAWRREETPDTYLIGFNHMRDFGIDAEFVETPLMNKLRKINFNLTNLLLIFRIRKYDIIFSGSSLLLPFVVKVILRMKKPKFVWYNTFFTNALKRNRKGWKNVVFRMAIDSLDAIVCPTNVQKDFLIKQGFKEEKLFFIPNGIDAEYIFRTLNKFEGVPKVDIGVFNTEPEHSLDSREDLLKRGYVVSVGKDNGRDYKTLINAVKDTGISVKIVALPRNMKNVGELPWNVEFLGSVPFDETLKLYQKADVVVIPTKKEDHADASDCSGQYALLDAMAAGKAIVVSERETLSDYVTNEENAITVPPEDIYALRNAIVRLKTDAVYRAKIAKKAQTKVNKNFTTRRFAKDLSEIFKSL